MRKNQGIRRKVGEFYLLENISEKSESLAKNSGII